jgi:hypothetical protein
VIVVSGSDSDVRSSQGAAWADATRHALAIATGAQAKVRVTRHAYLLFMIIISIDVNLCCRDGWLEEKALGFAARRRSPGPVMQASRFWRRARMQSVSQARMGANAATRVAGLRAARQAAVEAGLQRVRRGSEFVGSDDAGGPRGNYSQAIKSAHPPAVIPA